ncbi:hypothetical protein SNEBB_010742 [Seison nebaliae]|nr:hypothetical protein SNEBB_010742 [Seison nebaliae]
MNHSNNLINQITETKIQKVNRKRSFQPSSVSTSSNNTATNNDLVNNNRSSSAIKKLHIDPSLSTNNEIDLNFIQFNIRDVNGNLPSFMTDKSVDADGKPTQSYIGLISISILSSDEKRLVLADIYKWIEDNYEYFRTRGPGWRNSIRHNLSLNDCFIKAGRAANGKGHYWAIHPANIQDFCRGDFRRRRAQRRVRKLMGYSLHDPTESDDDITQQQQSLQRQQQQNIHKINNTENTSPITLNNNNSETLKHFLQLLQKSKMKEKSIKKTNTKFFIQNLVEISDTIDLPEEDDSLCTSDISQSTPSTNSSYRFCNDDSDCSSGIVES